MNRFTLNALLGALALASASCHRAPPEPQPEPEPQAQATPHTATSALPAALAKPTPKDAGPANVAQVPISPDDPLHGKFTLKDATRHLPGKGALTADIVTDQGKLTCRLYAHRAPITVANFVGLARGIRPWKDPDGKWVKRPAYDGTTFHRVIQGFMIQGGDPAGNGTGEPGYVIPDEIWAGASHDRRGLLCMANRGPNTNGQQFFILDAPTTRLDGGYTIFGECEPGDVIHAIASVPVVGDRPVKPPKIIKVTIRRAPAKKK
jgi:peptidyl-prolyl cis-trans isomerase A (cyclophilin A)